MFLRNSKFEKSLSKSYSLTKGQLKQDLDLSLLNTKIKQLLTTESKVLQQVSSYYFSQGKHIRPLLVLLAAQATNSSIPNKINLQPSINVNLIKEIDINGKLNDLERSIIFEIPPQKVKLTELNESNTIVEIPPQKGISESQRRLSQITEMIHTASLLHDDVIDESEQRRQQESCNLKYSNKMAILGGDFLLSRACVALSRLGNIKVVEVLSTCISDLVEGEFMQLRSSGSDTDKTPTKTSDQKLYEMDFITKNFNPTIENQIRFQNYLLKSYLKTASLISLSMKASVMLGESSKEVQDMMYNYGKFIGLAFQIIDDCLDFTGDSKLGKPVGQDLGLGLCTAPVYYALEEFPELEVYLQRGFSEIGDDKIVYAKVLKSDGIKKAIELAEYFCQRARDELAVLKESEAKEMLLELTRTVISRTK